MLAQRLGNQGRSSLWRQISKDRAELGSVRSPCGPLGHVHLSKPNEESLAIAIATINVWNRLNVTTRQVAGEWANSAEARASVENRSVRG